MTTVTKHAAGTFCWPELATSDEGGANAFYTSLFGWNVETTPVGEDMNYNEAKVGDKAVAAFHELTKEQQGIPPHWLNYVAVASADETVTKVKAAGGNVHVGPLDVFDLGRMAVIQDPTGATLGIWEAKSHIGAGLLGATGASCWTELMTSDTDVAGKFYEQVFPWTSEAKPMKDPAGNEMTYTVFSTGDGMAAGMMKLTPEMKGVPPHWLIYFAVDDTDASTKKTEALGGKIIVPPMDIPGMGRFSVLQDPQGAVFAIFQPASA